MAIQFRAGRKSPWRVYWINPHSGRRESVSFATEAEARKHDALVKFRLKFERESFVDEEQEEKPAGKTTLETAYLAYLREKQFAQKSLEAHVQHMRQILLRLGEKLIDEITREDIDSMAKYLLAGTVSQATVNTRLSKLRTIMRWAADRGMCGQVDFPRLPAAHYKRFVPPTPAEVSAIMAVALPHIERVIVLGAQCGCRVGPCELLGLEWDDVDLDRGIIRIHGSRKNPNAPWREVPIRDSLLPMFRQWHEQDAAQGLPWVINYKGKKVGSIKTAWRATLRRAGIARRIRPYDLRHAFGTELVAAGVDVGTVASLMGHSNPTMLLSHYQYVFDSQKKAAIERLPNIENVPRIMCPKNEGSRTHP